MLARSFKNIINPSVLMKRKNYFTNIIGQTRIYSIIDLILFLFAISANNREFAGIILLHLGFLFYLEYSHKHKERVQISKLSWIILLIAGIILFNKLAVIGFLIFSFLYVHKNKTYLGAYAPFFRGAQFYFLASGIAGFLNPLSFLAFGLLTIRNFAGDLRDVTKDKKAGMKTLPIIFRFKKDFKYLHLIAILITSFIWWFLAGISIIWLISAYVLQVLTYNLTPR